MWLIVFQDPREAKAAGISLQAPAKIQAGISQGGPEDFHVVGPREVQVEGMQGLCRGFASPSSLCSVCYERVPWYPTVFTFVLSALWHGVYPGYYFTFLTGVPVTLAARAVSTLQLLALFL